MRGDGRKVQRALRFPGAFWKALPAKCPSVYLLIGLFNNSKLAHTEKERAKCLWKSTLYGFIGSLGLK